MATLQSGRAFVPILAFRWLAWGLTAGLLGAGITPRGGASSTLLGLLVAYTAAYTLLWTLRLPIIARLATQRPVLLLVDLLLSMLPVWLTGGWSSPFVPFVFGALMLPGALFHWRGACVAVGIYLVLDQIVSWASWRPGMPIPLASPFVLLGYVRPLAAASIWPLSVELWRLRAGRPSPITIGPTLSIRASAPVADRSARRRDVTSETGNREAEPGMAAAWSLGHPRSQTLERPVVLELHAAVRQAICEAEAQGLIVHFVTDGTEPALPPGHIQLLAKAVEVGLDNIRCHAHTCEAEVTLVGCPMDEGMGILLTVRDHGTGLLDGTAEPPGFHQLKRLRYRLQEVEGTLDVREDDDGGVVLTVRMPVAQ